MAALTPASCEETDSGSSQAKLGEGPRRVFRTVPENPTPVQGRVRGEGYIANGVADKQRGNEPDRKWYRPFTLHITCSRCPSREVVLARQNGRRNRTTSCTWCCS